MSDEAIDPTDPAVQKRALKAFRKRLKSYQLDDESSLGHGAFSGGKASGVTSIKPPNLFPRAVWDELVKQGKLIESNSLYELV